MHRIPSDLHDESNHHVFLPPTDDAIEAIIHHATSSRLPTDGRPYRDTRTQLFVGNLPYRVRWQDLKDLFRKAGTVLRADVSLGPDNRSRGYGTVLLATAEDAGRAVDMFNGYSWQSRVLEVRLDRLLPEYDLQALSHPQTHAHTQHTHAPFSSSAPPTAARGSPATSAAGYSSASTSNRILGLVLNPLASSSTLSLLHPASISASSVGGHNASMGVPSSPFRADEQEYLSTYQSSDPNASRNLFVGNLPFHCQWQDLKDLFRQAGTILRADVALGPDGRSRGFGTVAFATEYDAERAVKMFNGYEYNNRVLKVNYDKFSQANQPHLSSSSTPFSTTTVPTTSPTSLSAPPFISHFTDNHNPGTATGTNANANTNASTSANTSTSTAGNHFADSMPVKLPPGFLVDYMPSSSSPGPTSPYEVFSHLQHQQQQQGSILFQPQAQHYLQQTHHHYRSQIQIPVSGPVPVPESVSQQQQQQQTLLRAHGHGLQSGLVDVESLASTLASSHLSASASASASSSASALASATSSLKASPSQAALLRAERELARERERETEREREREREREKERGITMYKPSPISPASTLTTSTMATGGSSSSEHSIGSTSASSVTSASANASQNQSPVNTSYVGGIGIGQVEQKSPSLQSHLQQQQQQQKQKQSHQRHQTHHHHHHHQHQHHQHPNHPGPISLPPHRPPAFPAVSLSPYMLTPHGQVSPLYHPSIGMNMNMNMGVGAAGSPYQMYSSSGVYQQAEMESLPLPPLPLTPHGLPPITPLMPPFNFQPPVVQQRAQAAQRHSQASATSGYAPPAAATAVGAASASGSGSSSSSPSRSSSSSRDSASRNTGGGGGGGGTSSTRSTRHKHPTRLSHVSVAPNTQTGTSDQRYILPLPSPGLYMTMAPHQPRPLAPIHYLHPAQPGAGVGVGTGTGTGTVQGQPQPTPGQSQAQVQTPMRLNLSNLPSVFSPGVAMSPGTFYGRPGEVMPNPNPYINAAVGAPVHVHSPSAPFPMSAHQQHQHQQIQAQMQMQMQLTHGAYFYAMSNPNKGGAGGEGGRGEVGGDSMEPKGYFDPMYFPAGVALDTRTETGGDRNVEDAAAISTNETKDEGKKEIQGFHEGATSSSVATNTEPSLSALAGSSGSSGSSLTSWHTSEVMSREGGDHEHEEVGSESDKTSSTQRQTTKEVREAEGSTISRTHSVGHNRKDSTGGIGGDAASSHGPLMTRGNSDPVKSTAGKGDAVEAILGRPVEMKLRLPERMPWSRKAVVVEDVGTPTVGRPSMPSAEGGGNVGKEESHSVSPSLAL